MAKYRPSADLRREDEFKFNGLRLLIGVLTGLPLLFILAYLFLIVFKLVPASSQSNYWYLLTIGGIILVCITSMAFAEEAVIQHKSDIFQIIFFCTFFVLIIEVFVNDWIVGLCLVGYLILMICEMSKDLSNITEGLLFIGVFGGFIACFAYIGNGVGVLSLNLFLVIGFQSLTVYLVSLKRED